MVKNTIESIFRGYDWHRMKKDCFKDTACLIYITNFLLYSGSWRVDLYQPIQRFRRKIRLLITLTQWLTQPTPALGQV